MLLNQDNIKDLRALFCNAVIKIFGGTTARVIRYVLIDEIIEYMEQLEEEEDDET